MIPGLMVGEEAEAQIWSAFAAWADHFRSALRDGGVAWLLAEYRALVQSIETQCCSHGPDGQRLTGRAWQACCGISYEYYNDVAVRDALDVLLSLTPEDARADVLREVDEIDRRFRRLFPDHLPVDMPWWRAALPRGVAE